MDRQYPKFVKQHEEKMNKTKLAKARDYFMDKISEYLNKHYRSDYGVSFRNNSGKLKSYIICDRMKDNLGFTKKRIEKVDNRLQNLCININYLVSLKGNVRKNMDQLECYIIPEMWNDNDNFVKLKVNKDVSKIYGYSTRIENKDSSPIINKKMEKFILLIENVLKVSILASSNRDYIKKLKKVMDEAEAA